MHATLPLLEKSDFPAIRRARLETLQVNLGYRCNQQCLHCHVNAGPNRTENMERDTVEQIISLLKAADIKQLDLTGGAPEMNPHFRYLVESAAALGVKVIDRCNLTILFEEGQEDLAAFLAQHKVDVVASLPCYLKENVDKQRGKGVFDASLEGLKTLNEQGYGKQDSGPSLNLMYNPQGPSLPPSQTELQAAYRKHLLDEYGIHFNQLFTLTNMPIQRFGSMLISKGTFDDYMQLLRDNFKQENLDSVMCRSLVSVDWRGNVYDCDFNQMLDLPPNLAGKPTPTVADLINLYQNGNSIEGCTVVVKDHCYGCTAGQGSSCSGAL